MMVLEILLLDQQSQILTPSSLASSMSAGFFMAIKSSKRCCFFVGIVFAKAAKREPKVDFRSALWELGFFTTTPIQREFEGLRLAMGFSKRALRVAR